VSSVESVVVLCLHVCVRNAFRIAARTASSCVLSTTHPYNFTTVHFFSSTDTADNATVRLEVLSIEPRIFRVRNFASAAELATLQKGVETGVSASDAFDTGTSVSCVCVEVVDSSATAYVVCSSCFILKTLALSCKI